MLPKVLYVLACLIIPVLWGVIVHAVFRRFRSARTGLPSEKGPRDDSRIEYYI
jgi:hypothetical protein